MTGEGVTRRRFGLLTGGSLAWLACGGGSLDGRAQEGRDGLLGARPRKAVKTRASGAQPLGLDRNRDAILQVPATAAGALPLLVLLHGAGGSGAGILRRLGQAAQDAGFAVLAPDARAATWDAIGRGFGPDVAFLDRALERVFEQVDVDATRITVGGFSDGATYALSLGVINGGLFRRILAFSPGFLVGGQVQGRPRIFVSHGTADPILPIDRCSRVIVPELRKRGYDITFREFEGGHTIPAEIAADGMRWATAK